MAPEVEWFGDRVRVGDLTFLYGLFPSTGSEHEYVLAKTRPLIERYLQLPDLLATLRVRNVVEIGVFRGGGLALLAALLRPERVVGIDSATPPTNVIERLAQLSTSETSITAHFQTDQADSAALHKVVESEFGSSSIDLVIDDGSHLPLETIRSFDALFPRLTPGGLYIVEDWVADHILASMVKGVVDQDQSLIEKTNRVYGVADIRMRALRQALSHLDPAEAENLPTALGRAREHFGLHSDMPFLGESVSHPLRGEPMTRLVMGLILGLAQGGGEIADISLDRCWTVIRRGPTALDPLTYRLEDSFFDPYGEYTGARIAPSG